MTKPNAGGARRPPRWFMRMTWRAHRALVRRTDGRRGLWRPRDDRPGTLRLTTTGRRTGEQRQVIVGYLVDGADLVVIAMNGGGPGEPAWWLNLQAHPEAVVQTNDGIRPVRARRAEGTERDRLWARWRTVNPTLEAYAAGRAVETAVVVLEPRET